MPQNGIFFYRVRRCLAALLALICLVGSSLTVYAAESFSGSSAAVRLPQTYCGMKEHRHTESCYQTEPVLSCPLQEGEGHTHSAVCYGHKIRLVCSLSEGKGHSHSESCFTEKRVLICTLPENEEHSHSDACYRTERVLSCSLPEQPAHVHTSSCYEEDVRYICSQENDPTHVHTDECLPPDSFVLICGKAETPAHTHTASCYTEQKLLCCTIPAHKHSRECYASGSPIVETETDWLNSVESARLNGDWRHDLLEIAKTQLGYGPDGTNTVTDASGQLRYYTRYGDWYTDGSLMYEDWCLMFVSFCLHYAGIDALPYGCGCQSWLESVDSSLYHPYGDGYVPCPGDIVLFTYGRRSFREENILREQMGMEPLPESSLRLNAEHVGILSSMNARGFRTIEGNNGPVGYHSYSFGTEEEPGGEELLLGFVSVPENPHFRTITDLTGHCSAAGDFSAFVRPYLREPTFREYQLWEQSNDPAALILGWGVCFEENGKPYTPQGTLHYVFSFDRLPENVKVTYLTEKGLEELPCTVSGQSVSFSTTHEGTFIFSKA